jgi:hypothetical protein
LLPQKKRAMHLCVVEPFLKLYYDVAGVDEQDMHALAESVATTLERAAAADSAADGAADNMNGSVTDNDVATFSADEDESVQLQTATGSVEDGAPKNSSPNSEPKISDAASKPARDPMIIRYDGSEWVDAVAEWDAVPEHLQKKKSKWHMRMGGVGISIAACRVAKLGDIRQLTEERTGGTKSVYVPLSLWTNMLKRVTMGGDAAKDAKVIHRELNHHLPTLELDANETFYHDGVALDIGTYGTRDKDNFYASYNDFTKALALRQASHVPDVEVLIADTDAGSITVLDFRGMLRLVAMYAHKSSVASALMDWVTDVVFRVQFACSNGRSTDSAPIPKQAEYASYAGLADRSAEYSACHWSVNGARASAGLYQDEVCSGTAARDRWPSEVDAALAQLPEGTDIRITSVVKVGHTVDKAERTRKVRTSMRKAFGPETDTRTVAFARCPGGTRETLQPLETEVLDEFETFRLHGIQAVDGQMQVELFLVTPLISQRISSALSVSAEKFCNVKLVNADAQVLELDSRASAAAILEERINGLVRENKHVIRENERMAADLSRANHESDQNRSRITNIGSALRECLDDESLTTSTVINRIARQIM